MDRSWTPTTTRAATVGSSSRLGLVVALAGLAALGISLWRESSTPLGDPDLWWHVLLGRRLAESWSFAGPEPLTGSAAGYVYNQWLPELLYAAADRVAGLAGVVWVVHVTRVAWLVVLYAVCRSFAPPLLSTLVCGVSLLASGGSLSPRPQVVGLTLLAVTVWAWLRSADDGRARWWLIPLTWFWAGSHGTWAVGLAVGGLAVVARYLDRHRDRGELARLVLVLAGSAAATLLTPVGPQLLGVFTAVNAISPYINEWKPLSVTSTQLGAVVGLFAVVVLAWLSRSPAGEGSGAGGTGAGPAPSGVPWSDRLLALAALAMALTAARSAAIGGVLLAPVAARTLAAWFPSVPRSRLERPVVAAIAAVLLVVPLAWVSTTSVANPALIPTRLSTQLSALPAGTVVFNADTLGGWLMWAHPSLRVVYDTRAEAYGAAYVDRYMNARAVRPGWERTIADSSAAVALLETGSPLGYALTGQLGWTEVGVDAGYRLLRAPARP